MKKAGTWLLALLFAASAIAQNTENPSPILFIYDASGSMWGQIAGKTKMEIAVNALSNSIGQLPEDQQIGLVVYGHRSKDDCQDVEFLVDLDKGSKSLVTDKLKTIKPLGRTPLAYSAELVIEKLKVSKTKATVILVTDGIESCGGNICDVIKAAKAAGIDFRLHIIGFGLKGEDTKQLECAAQAGDGQYFDAADAGNLAEVLQVATKVTVDKPSGNFTIFAVKNGKPVDAYVKAYAAGTKTTINLVRTYRDTALLFLPAGTYDLDVQPLENTDVKAIIVPNIKIEEGKPGHQTISFDGAKITISTFNNGEGWDALVRIYPKGSTIMAATGRTYGKPAVYEVNPGIYDIELTAIAMDGLQSIHRLKDIEIKSGENKQLEHHYKTGIAMIGANSSGGLVDATVSIKDSKTKAVVSSSRTYIASTTNPKKFLLTPGMYEVTVTSVKGISKGQKQIFTIEVKAGVSLEKIIDF